MEAFFEEDELTPEDLEFLKQWESAGKDSDKHEQNILSEVEAEGHTEVEAEVEDPKDTEGVGDETDENSDQGGGESIEGDEVDESELDISHMDGEDNSESGSDDGEDELSEEEIGDYSDADDDDLDFEDEPKHDTELSDQAEDRDQLESGDTESDIPEGESDLEYDHLEEPDSDSSDSDNNNDSDDSEFDSDFEDDEGSDESNQVEEEFGDGERANTDEEIENLDEYEKEREEHEQELNAEGEDDFEGDAQAELEDHLRDNQEDSEPESDEGNNDSEDSEADSSGAPDPEPEDSDDADSNDGADNGHEAEDSAEDTEREPLTEEPDENQEGGEEQYSGMFENLPEAGNLCTNHCEDNPPEDSLEETCPHCTERIRKERELHGAIATDMHGNEVLPGDKLHVKVPIAMIAKDAIITANVPNTEVDPVRLAENNKGQTDIERCWLSGKGVSKFTSWHMTEAKGQSIWTFKKGDAISFAEKIAQPLFDSDDPEDIMDKLKEELDNLPETEEPGGSNGEQEAETEKAEPQDDAPEDELETPGDEPDDQNEGDSGTDQDDGGESDDSSGEPESEIEIEDTTPELLAELSKLNAMAKVFDLENASNYLTDLLKAMGEGA